MNSVSINEGNAVSTMDLLKSTLVKETVAGAYDIATITPDFYKQISVSINDLSSSDFKEARRIFDKIYGLRLNKIQTKAIFGPLNEEIESRLSPEEIKLYNSFHESCSNLKQSIFSGELQ